MDPDTRIVTLFHEITHALVGRLAPGACWAACWAACLRQCPEALRHSPHACQAC